MTEEDYKKAIQAAHYRDEPAFVQYVMAAHAAVLTIPMIDSLFRRWRRESPEIPHITPTFSPLRGARG